MAQVEAAPRRPATFRSIPARLATSLGVAAAVVLADQSTKALVRSRLAEGDAWPHPDALLAISHVENSGAAFGMFQGAGAWLLLVTVIGVAGVLVYLWKVPPSQPLYLGAVSLILGGAIGNLIDRVTKGTVTDFIDPTHYPAFNLADSSIVVGVCTVLLLSVLEDRRT